MMLVHEVLFRIWRVISEQQTWSAIDQVLARCVRKGPCKSMLLLPEMVCSEHELFSREMMAEGVRSRQFKTLCELSCTKAGDLFHLRSSNIPL